MPPHHPSITLSSPSPNAPPPNLVGKAFYDLSHAHPHDKVPPEYPYLKIRSKPFPWGDGDTGLFETKHH